MDRFLVDNYVIFFTDGQSVGNNKLWWLTIGRQKLSDTSLVIVFFMENQLGNCGWSGKIRRSEKIMFVGKSLSLGSDSRSVKICWSGNLFAD
jgi:hypothetical protein